MKRTPRWILGPAATAALLALIGGFGVGTPARAGGLYIPGVGTQALGRAGAFVARADDPTALYHNPAGFAKHEGTLIQLGVNMVDHSLRYQRAGTYDATDQADLPWEGDAYAPVENEASPSLGVGSYQAIPLLAASTDLGLGIDRLRFGMGVFAPNAYPARSFEAGYVFEDPNTPPPPNRYDVIEQEAATVMPSLAVSLRVADNLDIGVRGTWGVASLQATTHTWGSINYEEWAGLDGEFQIDVSDNFVPSYGVGVLYRPARSIEIGASYASEMVIDGQGTGVPILGSGLANPITGDPAVLEPVDDTALCAPGGEIGALKACVEVVLPRTATLGARWILGDGKGGERADVELDVRWEDWSAATDQKVIVDGRERLTGAFLQESLIRHGFQDVFSLRLGGSYRVPLGSSAVVVSAGAAHDTATAPTSFQRLDIDGAARTTFAGGLAYVGTWFRVDAAGGAIVEADRTVEDCQPNFGTEGCPPGSGQIPVGDRVSPDPVQPLFDQNSQFQSPFNAGDYSSGYVMFSLAGTVWF